MFLSPPPCSRSPEKSPQQPPRDSGNDRYMQTMRQQGRGQQQHETRHNWTDLLFNTVAHTAAVAVGDVYFMVTPLLFIDSGRRTRRRHQPHPHDIIITRQHHPVRFIIIILNKIEMQRFHFDPWRFVDKYCPLSCVYVVFLFTATHLCLTCLITNVV